MRTKVRRRPNGRWYVMSVGENGKERSHGGYRTQREARATARSLNVDAARGRYVEPSGRTLDTWYVEWQATRKNLSPNSRAVEGVMWRLILE